MDMTSTRGSSTFLSFYTDNHLRNYRGLWYNKPITIGRRFI